MTSPAAAVAISENRHIRAELRQTLDVLRGLTREYVPRQPTWDPKLLLLQMAEGLIVAHRAAKQDQDGYTLDLIEDALFHVGKRLSKEVGKDTFAQWPHRTRTAPSR